MINKRIVVSVGAYTNKDLRARLSLLLEDTEAGGVIFEHFHSIEIPVGADLAFLREMNEKDLARPASESGIPGSPWPKIPDDEWAEVEAIAALIHTPERIAKRRIDDEKARLKVSELLNAAQAARTK